MGKATKVLSVIAIILAVMVGGSFLLYTFSVPFRTSVDNIALSPEKLYSKAQTKETTDIAKSVGGVYSKISDITNGKNDKGYNSSISVTLGKPILEKLNVSDLKAIGINASFNSKDKKCSENVTVNYDSKTLLTLNSVSDTEKNITYLQAPELSTAYLSIKADEVKPILEEKGLSLNSLFKQFGLGSNAISGQDEPITNFALSEQQVKEIVDKYMNIILKTDSKIVRENNVSGDIDGAAYKCTKLTYEITCNEYYEISKKVLTEAKNDATLKKFMTEQGSMTESDYDKTIQDKLDSLEQDKNTPENYGYTGDSSKFNTDMKFLSLVTYVDSDKNIIGREIKSLADFEDASFGYMKIDNATNYAINLWLKKRSADSISLKGNLAKSGSKYNGTINLKITSDSKTSTGSEVFKDYEIVDKDKNLVNGSIAISTEKDGKKYDVELTLKADKEKQSVNSVISQDGEKYLTADISYEPANVSDIKLPDSSKDKIYDSNNQSDMQSYYSGINVDGFTKNVSDALGTEVWGKLTSGLSGGSSDIISGDSSIKTDTLQADKIVENTYDFSKIKYGLNGKQVSFPFEASMLSSLVKFDKSTLDAGDYSIGASDDMSIFVRAQNNKKSSLAIDKCLLEKISIDKTAVSKADLIVNDIKIGSSLSDVVTAFSLKPDTQKDGNIVIIDQKTKMNTITFVVEDGKVTGINVDFYSY